MSWRPSSSPQSARHRACLLQLARDYFADQQVLEVCTPVLSRVAVSDPQIESIGTRLSVLPGREHYLRTSPEFCMKRLLAAGYPDIYEIGPVFRDGEVGPRHQPEFTMIEWYRLNFGLMEIIEDTLSLISTMLGQPELAKNALRLSYRHAMQEYAGADPIAADLETLKRAANADPDLSAALGDERDDWLNFILSHKLAPGFATDRLTILFHYPASQAALARITPDDNTVADRFEVFLGELELANGYVELNDAIEQRDRFAADQEERTRRGMPLRPIDEQLLAALDGGLPNCAGVAVGFDRLHMIFEGSNNIAAVQTFAFNKAD